MNLEQKKKAYQELVNKFRNFIFPDGLYNPFQVPDSQNYNYQVINPFELWHGNLDAETMLIGQDWGDVSYFLLNFGTNWQNEIESTTNRNLGILFSHLGCDVGLPNPKNPNNSLSTTSTPTHKLFFTNAILGIKQGGMQAAIQDNWMNDESCTFLKETIEIIQPKRIVTMGKVSYEIISHIYQEKTYKRLGEAIDNNGKHNDIFNSKLYIVAHCSQRGQISRNFDQQEKDWCKIKDLIGAIDCKE